jgi:hypothetical protein
MLPRTEIKERITLGHYREFGDAGSKEKFPDTFELQIFIIMRGAAA